MLMNKKPSSKTTILQLSLIIAAYFTATQSISEKFAWVSIIAVIGFALPSYTAFVRSLGSKKGLYLLITLAVYAVAVETFAIKTGWLYGDFLYTGSLGLKLFGVTPWTIIFAWPPIAIGAVALSSGRLAKSVILMVLADLVLDPGAVDLGFWSWPAGGFWYGVPIVNYLGWVVSSFVICYILNRFAVANKITRQPGSRLSYILMIWFWSFIGLFNQQYLVFAIGVGIFVYINAIHRASSSISRYNNKV
jgi:bisanhydrobacterioruberin hydratase